MFLNWDFGIPNSILCLNPRIRPWKLPLNFFLTLKMLQHSAQRKFLALLSCVLPLKPSWCLKDFEFECTQKNLRWNRAQKPLLLSLFHPICIQIRNIFSGVPLGSLQLVFSVCARYISSQVLADHYKIGLGGKEMPFLYITIKLSVEFMYQFSICRVIHKLGEQVKFHCLPGGRLLLRLVAPSRTPCLQH